jgi:hypothetical protein
MKAQRSDSTHIQEFFMPYRDFDQMEDAMFPQREPIKPMVQSLGLSNAPTTLAVLGMSLAKSLGYSPFIGGLQEPCWVV